MTRTGLAMFLAGAAATATPALAAPGDGTAAPADGTVATATATGVRIPAQLAQAQVVGYRQKPSSPAVVAAEAALRTHGYEPKRIATGGASDANVFEAAGIPCVNVANGTQHNHEPTERVTQYALVDGTDAQFEYVAGDTRELNGERFVQYSFAPKDSDPLQGQADPNEESKQL